MHSLNMHSTLLGLQPLEQRVSAVSKRGVACGGCVLHVACREHDQGHRLTTETELNWVKLIHSPAEIFPRAPGGKSQLHLTSH